jgi:hypothetical protein
MRFLIGLAALTYTLATVGPLGWFLLFMATVFCVALFLVAWPWLLAGAAVLGSWVLVQKFERRRA